MGHVRDVFVNSGGSMEEMFVYIGGVVMTSCGVIIFGSTFIPKNSCVLCPGQEDYDPIDTTDEKEMQRLVEL
jgi:hypothetical protein